MLNARTVEIPAWIMNCYPGGRDRDAIYFLVRRVYQSRCETLAPTLDRAD